MGEIGFLHLEEESYRPYIPPEVGAVGARRKTFPPFLSCSSTRQRALSLYVGWIFDWLPSSLIPSSRLLFLSDGRSFDWSPATFSATRHPNWSFGRFELGGEIVCTILQPPKFNYTNSAVFARENLANEGQRPFSCSRGQKEGHDVAHFEVLARPFGFSGLAQIREDFYGKWAAEDVEGLVDCLLAASKAAFEGRPRSGDCWH